MWCTSLHRGGAVSQGSLLLSTSQASLLAPYPTTEIGVMQPEHIFWDKEVEAENGQELSREDPGWCLLARGWLCHGAWASGLQSQCSPGSLAPCWAT